MALFGSSDMSKEVVTQGTEYNTLAFGTKVVGEINAESNFRLDGEVEGTINCKGKVIIGAKGVMKGSLTCSNAEILGSLNGTILVSDTLLLKSSARVEGEIKTKILSIEPNAKFTGTCDMSDSKTEHVSEKK